MDKKSNTLSGSREHIAELSDIIKTAVLREIGVHKPKEAAADVGSDSEAASLKLCNASAIKERLPDMMPPITCASVKTIFAPTAHHKRRSLISDGSP